MVAQDIFSVVRHVAFAATVTLLPTWYGWAEESGGPNTSPSTPAERRADAALRSELAGNNPQPANLLRATPDESPDHALAHWQSGQVRVKNTWMPVADVEKQAREDRNLAEYQRLRAATAPTVAGQAGLARWCLKNHLDDEQRAHWSMVLQLQPDNAEAIAALKLKPYLGALMTAAQIQQMRKQVHEVSEAEKRWRPLVARWRSAAEHGQAAADEIQAQLRAIVRPTEMLALERTLWQQGAGWRKPSPYRPMTAEMIAILADNPHPAVSESLARHAAFAKFADIRDAAIRALAQRPLDHYVPQLLSALQSPVEEEVQYRLSASGHLAAQYVLWQEGPLGNLRTSLLLSPVVQNEVVMMSSDPADTTSSIAAVTAWQKNAARSMLQASSDAAAFHANVERTNQEIRSRNARVTTVLSEATGQPLGDEPMKWWKWWWQDYNEQYEIDGRNSAASDGQPPRPEYQNHAAYDYPVYAPPDNPSRSAGGYEVPVLPRGYRIARTACSCFARGTKVWKLTGRVPIEQIRVGDRVLAQDPESGELAYKPVLGVTLRPPGPRAKIVLHDEAITATPSHPFWVIGQGWRMTKQLGTSDALHALSGSVPIETIEPVETPLAHYEFAYNLIVADFSTYFVGDGGILVHDNTPRQPTPALVPGLAASNTRR